MNRRAFLICSSALALLPTAHAARIPLEPAVLRSGSSKWLVLKGSEVTFGRGRGSQVRLGESRCVSRQHLRIQKAGRGWSIVDLSSGNGTVLGRTRVGSSAVALANGQTLVVAGKLNYSVRIGSDFLALDPGRGADVGYVIRVEGTNLSPQTARLAANAASGSPPQLLTDLGALHSSLSPNDDAHTFCGTPEY